MIVIYNVKSMNNNTPLFEKRRAVVLVNKLYELAELTVNKRQNINDTADEIVVEFMQQEMNRLLEDALCCNKEINGNGICKVRLDCHLHDWRQKEEMNRVLGEVQERIRESKSTDTTMDLAFEHGKPQRIGYNRGKDEDIEVIESFKKK